MLKTRAFLLLLFSCLVVNAALFADDAKDDSKDSEKKNEPVVPKDSTTQGTVTIGGHAINYQALAGTILVGANNEADAAIGDVAAVVMATG